MPAGTSPFLYRAKVNKVLSEAGVGGGSSALSFSGFAREEGRG